MILNAGGSARTCGYHGQSAMLNGTPASAYEKLRSVSNAEACADTSTVSAVMMTKQCSCIAWESCIPHRPGIHLAPTTAAAAQPSNFGTQCHSAKQATTNHGQHRLFSTSFFSMQSVTC